MYATVERPVGHSLVRITSHRARGRVLRIVPAAEMLFARGQDPCQMRVEAEFAYIPNDSLDFILAIPGVKPARPRDDLFRPVLFRRS
jgi:hypothetical protein